MSGERPISRRELLRGRFLGRLADSARSRIEDVVGRSTPQTDEPEPPRTDLPPGHAPGSMVMRYPSTREQAAPAPRRSIPVHRPPGAVDEATFLDACTRCEACLEACPHDAITHAPPRFREAAGTPMIEADHAPCRMCDDLPCIDACEPDVLSRLVPVRMGTARITEQTCLAHQGMTCTVCAEHCPVEDAIVFEDGRPRIVEDACTGCGVCRHVCPSPANAILLMPTFVRPPRPSGEEAVDAD